MAEVQPGLMGEGKIPRAFFAALLEAQKSSCDCKCVKILKTVAEEMTKEFEGV